VGEPESFAGITVPEGDPDELRGAAYRMGATAAALRESGAEVEGMASAVDTWRGPASGAHASACLSLSGALVGIAEGRERAAAATNAFAEELEQARRAARAAIDDARDAKRRVAEARRGAVKHSIICAAWHMLSNGETYRVLGGDSYSRRNPERHTKRLMAQLERLGHTATLEKQAA